MERILVTRFSAMGDVAMLASVLTEFQQQHKQTEIILVTRPQFAAFFSKIPRLTLHPIEPKTKHKGITGLYRLSKELTRYNCQFFADMHNNLRSRIIGLFLRRSRIQHFAILDKGRAEKKALTAKPPKTLTLLKHNCERYADVLRKLGFSVNLTHQLRPNPQAVPEEIATDLKVTGNQKIIGIAPFAQHAYKVLPLEKMEEVIRQLSKLNMKVFLFGGGSKEKAICEQWQQSIPGVISTIGRFSLAEELNIISRLDLFISMDSSGMHMASLMGVPCLSIWGATHPYLGFLGYGQSLDDCIQVDHPNRPSSVYGNKSCLCDGVEAIDLIPIEMILSKVDEHLNKNA